MSHFCIEELTIARYHQALLSGEITTRELVMEYMKRIAEIDQAGPCINSVAELNPDALDLADEMDARLKSEGLTGPLHGVPVLLKDNINTGDKLHTTAGALALENNYAPEDCHVVKKLREAGALIFGKANMIEFANFVSSTMKRGYSSRGGQVLNPYKLSGYPSGSSTGSAVAAAANLTLVTLGTDTTGSILYPSNYNGVVGIKPTRGLVSHAGVCPISPTLDTVGPITRTVEDAARVLSVIEGYDSDDPATFCMKDAPAHDYAAGLGVNAANQDACSDRNINECEAGLGVNAANQDACSDRNINECEVGLGVNAANQDACSDRNVNECETGLGKNTENQDACSDRNINECETGLSKNSLNGVRIGINRGYMDSLTESEQKLALDAIEVLRNAGAVLIEGCDFPMMNYNGDVLDYEFKAALNEYLSHTRPENPIRTLQDVIDFNLAHPATALKYGQDILEKCQYETSGKLTDPAYIRALIENQNITQNGIADVMEKQELDVLFCPKLTDLQAFSGYPAVQVPAGLADGIPMGVTFIARPFQESRLIQIAYCYEQLSKCRTLPMLLP